MVSSDRSCLPSVKSTISIANDLKFIFYARVIEILNHKYHLFFSLPVLPLSTRVMIFWGLSWSAVSESKTTGRKQAQPGKEERAVVIVACWLTVIFHWPQHDQIVCIFLAFDTQPQLEGMVATALGHLFTAFLHVSVFHTDNNLLIFIKGSGPWGSVKDIWISNICFSNSQKFPYIVPAGQSLYLELSYPENSTLFQTKNLCLNEIKNHFIQTGKNGSSQCLARAFWTRTTN